MAEDLPPPELPPVVESPPPEPPPEPPSNDQQVPVKGAPPEPDPEPDPEAPPPAAPAELVVAPGQGLVTNRGVLGDGTVVTAKDFFGGDDTVQRLIEAGRLVRRPARPT